MLEGNVSLDAAHLFPVNYAKINKVGKYEEVYQKLPFNLKF